MSVSWQTGEPPQGEELLIEFLCDGRPRAWRDLATKRGIQWHLSGGPCSGVIEILRWSTLDDDRAAKAMGALEKYLRHNWLDQVHIGVGKEGEGFALYNVDEQRGAEAPTLTEAIEKLTEAGNGLQGD